MFEWADTRVLVTGASGFVGGHLCRRLIHLGADLHVVVRAATSGSLSFPCTTHVADLANAGQIADLVHAIRPQLIYHLAGITSAARRLDLVIPTLQSNLLGTVNLLSAVTSSGFGRCILAGSMECGNSGAGSSSPYAASKECASTYATMFSQAFGARVSVARLFMIYGPGQTDLSKVIPYTITRLLLNKSPALGSGARLVDWIYIDDVVAGLVAMGQTETCDGRRIDIGSGRLFSIRDVLERIARIIPCAASLRFGETADRKSEVVARADLQLGKTLMNWCPEVELEDGLRRTIAYYSASPQLFRSVE